MKIALRNQDGLAILDVSGEIDEHSLKVLKAGLSKLLRDGRNRIVLNLLDAKEIQGEVLREIAILDVFARELSGKIVLASNDAQLKESVRTFSKPPVIPILETVEHALEFFQKQSSEEADSEDPAELHRMLEAKDKQIAALESRLKLQDPQEARQLRAEKAELSAQVKTLMEQVEALTKEKFQPIDAEGFLEKIATLEAAVQDLSGKQEAGAKS